MRYITGWIKPNGNFVKCELFEHLDGLQDDEDVRQLTNIDELKAEIEHSRQGCVDLIEQGEHPEWHCYEMASDRCTRKLKGDLYQAGFIRVGTLNENLHFEGTAECLKLKKRHCSDFALENGFGSVFEPVKGVKNENY